MNNCQKLEQAPPLADDIKPGLLSKDKRNSNLLFPAVDSRHFVGAWAKSNEINQAKTQACGAVVALALS